MIWTNHRELRVKSLWLIALLLAVAGKHHAKSIDHTPEITSDAYWDSHHIGAVRIAAVGTDEQSREYIIYEMENQLSDGPIEQARTVPISHLWFGTDADETTHIALNDRLLIYYPKEEPGAVVAAKLDNGSESARTWNTLVQIARLRSNPADLAAYADNAFSGDPMVARYCLQHLLEGGAAQAKRSLLPGLLRLRDDESRDTRVRVLASRLADKLEGRPEYSDDEYVWLKGSLARSTENDWTQLTPFVDRLLGFENKRSDLVAFFAQLASDLGAKESVRIAAYSTFEDARMFQFDTPDALSEHIFLTCTQMLNDREPGMRAAGAALLHNLSRRVDVEDSATYLQRSRSAIGAALAAEQDDMTRDALDFYLGLVSK